MSDRDHSGDRTRPPASVSSCWATFLKAHALIVDRIEARLKAAGHPPLAWYDVLWALESAEDRQLRMFELADRMVITRSNLTRLVDRMEAAGLVGRGHVKTDRRGAHAIITDAGLATRAEMWTTYRQAIDDHFAVGLSQKDVTTLHGLLQRILRHR